MNMANDKRKIAQTIVSQFVKKDVSDISYDSSLGFEACARDIMKAIKEDNAILLAQALKSMCEIMKQQDSYSKPSVEIEIGS